MLAGQILRGRMGLEPRGSEREANTSRWFVAHLTTGLILPGSGDSGTGVVALAGPPTIVPFFFAFLQDKREGLNGRWWIGQGLPHQI